MAGVRLVLQFTAPTAAEAEKAIEGMVERCRKAQTEPGCIQFEVFRSALQPEKYALLEHWESEAALEEHRKQGMPPSNPAIKRVREHYQHQEA